MDETTRQIQETGDLINRICGDIDVRLYSLRAAMDTSKAAAAELSMKVMEYQYSNEQWQDTMRALLRETQAILDSIMGAL